MRTSSFKSLLIYLSVALGTINAVLRLLRPFLLHLVDKVKFDKNANIDLKSKLPV